MTEPRDPGEPGEAGEPTAPAGPTDGPGPSARPASGEPAASDGSAAGPYGALYDGMAGIGVPIADAFNRFWTMIDPSGPPRSAPGGSAARAAGVRDVRSAVTRLIDTQLDLMRTVVDAGVGMLLQVSDRTATAPGGGATTLPFTVRDGSATTEDLWLHNQTAAALSGPFAAGPLVSGLGHMIPPSAVTFEPAGVRRLEAGGSAATKVTIGPLSEQAEGRYYGFVFILGHADAVAHLVVDVGPDDGQPGSSAGGPERIPEDGSEDGSEGTSDGGR